MEADISIWQKTGHFYFALTLSDAGSVLWRALPEATAEESHFR